MHAVDPALAAQWKAQDAAHHLHPFTDTAALNAEGSRVIVRAEGVYLYDSEGTRILDAMGGLWCVNLGYGREDLVEAAQRQMRELPYYNTFFKTTHPAAVTLSRQLVEVTPDGLNHVFFCGSGSEANDTVVRMVRRYWALRGQPDRQTIIGRVNGYHGSTMAALSLGGMSDMHKQSGLLPGFAHIDPPHWFRLGFDQDPQDFGIQAARWLEDKILELGPETVGAFIGEPIQGAGGLIVPPDSYWPEIQRICKKYDILLVADEVICGFGRTGHWFGCDAFGIQPDLMPIAKGLSSGYLPIAGVMVSDRVADLLINEGGEFHHGFTYSAHPVCAAVASAAITALRDEKIIETVSTETGPYLQSRLRELADHPLVGEVRGMGFIAGLELIRDKKEHRFFEKPGAVGTVCRDHCFTNGLIMRAVGDTMVMAPPLVMTRDNIDDLVDTAWRCLDMTARDVLS